MYLAKVLLQQLHGRQTLLGIVLQTVVDEVVALLGEALRSLRLLPHAHLEHDLEIGIELCPGTL